MNIYKRYECHKQIITKKFKTIWLSLYSNMLSRWWTSLCSHLQILFEAARVVGVFVDGRRDPHVAVVTEDDAGATRQVVEMGLTSPDEAGRHSQQGALSQLKTAICTALIIYKHASFLGLWPNNVLFDNLSWFSQKISKNDKCYIPSIVSIHSVSSLLSNSSLTNITLFQLPVVAVHNVYRSSVSVYRRQLKEYYCTLH